VTIACTPVLHATNKPFVKTARVGVLHAKNGFAKRVQANAPSAKKTFVTGVIRHIVPRATNLFVKNVLLHAATASLKSVPNVSQNAVETNDYKTLHDARKNDLHVKNATPLKQNMLKKELESPLKNFF